MGRARAPCDEDSVEQKEIERIKQGVFHAFAKAPENMILKDFEMSILTVENYKAQLEAANLQVSALRKAIERVLADAESQHPGGWGPDVTMVGVLRDALSSITGKG
jgi:hypothetical protein